MAHHPAVGSLLLLASPLLTGGAHGAANDPVAPPPAVHGESLPPTSDVPIDALLAALRERWVFRGEVDWAEAEPALRSAIGGAATDRERAQALVNLFARVGDVHSVLTLRGASHAHFEGFDEPTRQRLLHLLERERAQSGRAVASIVDGRFGYILVPSMAASSPEQVLALARELHEKVVETARQGPVGWIVDLRLNGGGNLSPMLAGLRPLLGDGVVGGTIDAEGRLVQEWVLKPDGLSWRDATGDRRFVALDLSAQAPDLSIPVAVLVGPLTRSSGQAVALAFRGRPNCRLLGEATAKGYTTVTAPVLLGPECVLSLAVGYMVDRSGTPCRSQVLPDASVSGPDAFDSPTEDAKIQAALEWLRMRR